MNRLMLLFVIGISLLSANGPARVTVGADLLFTANTKLIDGKRVGLITNHTALLSNGKHLADALKEYPKTKLTALFGPEHGIRGDAPDGKKVNDSIDAGTGVTVYSLYGKINKPTPEMLKNVDVLIFDIQDVGARFYTFISTMFLCMEAAAENGKQFIVLDRPNPITGLFVEGPVRLDSLKTFVGWAPMPVTHGMTVGELATMANYERWFPKGMNVDLTVIKIEGWDRSLWYDQTSLTWVSPSPNMVSLATATVYPGLCLIEGTNVSEGRGTDAPFEMIGAPWINGKELSAALNGAALSGVTFSEASFTPKEISGKASSPKFNGRKCSGIRVTVTDRNSFRPFRTGLTILQLITTLYKDSLIYRDRGFDRLAGTPVIRTMLQEGKSASEIEKIWTKELTDFIQLRRKALLYH